MDFKKNKPLIACSGVWGNQNGRNLRHSHLIVFDMEIWSKNKLDCTCLALIEQYVDFLFSRSDCAVYFLKGRI